MTDDELFAVLSSVMPGKVFTPFAPMRTVAPYVIYQETIIRPTNSMCGDQDLDEVYWQIDSYALTKREAKTIMGAVRAALRATPFPPTVESEQPLYETETRLNRRLLAIITWTQPEKVTA